VFLWCFCDDEMVKRKRTTHRSGVPKMELQMKLQMFSAVPKLQQTDKSSDFNPDLVLDSNSRVELS
jgi:hypothetical protein